MISLRFDTARLAGREAGIYGFAGDGKKPSRKGRFQLWVDAEVQRDGVRVGDLSEGDDPCLEGDDAAELEQEAKRLGATAVTHWYEP